MKKLKIVLGGAIVLGGLFDCIDIVARTKPLEHPHPMQDIIENIAIMAVGAFLLRWGLKSNRVEF